MKPQLEEAHAAELARLSVSPPGTLDRQTALLNAPEPLPLGHAVGGLRALP